jgi:transposase InsO family protein
MLDLLSFFLLFLPSSCVNPNNIKSTPEITVENILNRNFTAEKLNEKWLTDVTEFRFGNDGRMYLSAILDLKDKSIVSYFIGRSNNNQLAFNTFDAAVLKYPDAKPLFHSDRGFNIPISHSR